jgi:hypothetical protein
MDSSQRYGMINLQIAQLKVPRTLSVGLVKKNTERLLHTHQAQ